MKNRLLCAAALAALIVGCGGSGGETGGQTQLGTDRALAVMELIIPRPEAEVGMMFEADTVVAATGVLVKHANLNVPPKIPPLLFTEISHYGVLQTPLSSGQLANLFGGSEVAQGTPTNPTFPLGLGQNVYTIKANMPQDLPEGDYYLFHMVVKGFLPVPISLDPTVLYQYAFVMDQDGDTNNNFMTSDLDFFNDTDRWYEITYADGVGWQLFVWDATNGGDPTEIQSAARVIFVSNAIVLVVPKSEFAVDPAYRVTSFCHDGDFGVPPPHSWTGDLHPTVAEGLEPFPMSGG